MSAKHPIIAVTGSSGAGTTSVTRTFNWIFRREHINAVLVEGDPIANIADIDSVSCVPRVRRSLARFRASAAARTDRSH